MGVFHRDIKPENILIGHDKRGILVDFGLCLKAEEAHSGQGIGDGTPEYAAPETRTRGWNLTAEIYSVFVCFTEAILGRCPFGGEVRVHIKIATRTSRTRVYPYLCKSTVGVHKEKAE